jgi:hypothetical protein
VEIWEGCVTLIFFPLLVLNAYVVDKKPWTWWRYRQVRGDTLKTRELFQKGKKGSRGAISK